MANWLDPASTLGIMAVAVALLMIGGHFDLSAGVMVGTTALTVGIVDAQNVDANADLASAGTR